MVGHSLNWHITSHKEVVLSYNTLIHKNIMTIQTLQLLQLLIKATKLNMSYKVCEDEDGDYVISFGEEYTYSYDTAKVVITQSSASSCNKGHWTLESMMIEFDVRLEEQEQERIKKEKRKELIATFTQEQRDLLGL